ncbi:MAG: biotin--[acetyl-CoA-carboxylase] ligase, partial [Clostridiales bacterium]|nr:biotin--[acetyl-CoA-carboxylase] ligase [Candidatus Crickella merdequi]
MIDKASLISLLREADTYVSGQELCEHFGVSRNAVWKVINHLRADGYEIEAVPNKGYTLLSTPDILSKEEIASRLSGAIGFNLFYYDSTDSTNIRIRRLAEEGAPTGTLAVADMQTAGRGRRGRTWLSPAGMNVYMSLLLKPDITPQTAPMITLLMALAVARGITEVTGLDAQIKWPNDIVVNGRKVCGILTEMDMEADYIRDVIVGVGININEALESDFAPDIRETATSLRIESGHVVNRADIIAKSMESFMALYETFLSCKTLGFVQGEYDSR